MGQQRGKHLVRAGNGVNSISASPHLISTPHSLGTNCDYPNFIPWKVELESGDRGGIVTLGQGLDLSAPSAQALVSSLLLRCVAGLKGGMMAGGDLCRRDASLTSVTLLARQDRGARCPQDPLLGAGHSSEDARVVPGL